MTDGNVFALKTPAQDTLNEVLKRGAQQLLAQAVEAEVAALLSEHETCKSMADKRSSAMATCQRERYKRDWAM
jgi:hypothetical protein